jgi:superfamily I DNA/RNA helicase
MHLPTYDELIPEQLDVLDVPLNQSLFVVGPPGSGKTVLAVRRALMLSETAEPSTLVTFNRLLRRLAALLSEHQTTGRTMHSFVWFDYKRRSGQDPVTDPADKYVFDWAAMFEALGAESEYRRWGHLVIDEGQDLESEFFRYAARHAAAAISVFADEDQGLTRHTTLEEIKAAGGLPDPKILRDNHRSVEEVAAVARHFHTGRLPTATVRRGRLRELPRLLQVAGPAAAADLIARWHQTRGGTVGVIVDRNRTGRDIHGHLSTHLPSTRVDIYTSKLSNENTIALLEPGITILNRQSAKGQEFDSVFILELDQLLPCRTARMKRTMYMLCSRARNNLALMHWQPLSRDAIRELPPPEVLERA